MKQILFVIVFLTAGFLSGSTARAQCNADRAAAGDTSKIAPETLLLCYFTINDGGGRTSDRTITLNHAVENGAPTFYSVSEDSTSLGKEWLLYTDAPTFLLSESMGLKDVYFMVANEHGVSNIMHDYVYLDVAVTVESRGLTAQVLPNPVETDVTITVDGEAPQVHVTIYSVSGMVCLSQTFKMPSFSIDLSRCPAGTLLIHLSSGQDYVVKRVIKL
jgi:hypothetical protein